METWTFFKILGFLLVVGTLASMISTVPLPAYSALTTMTFDTTVMSTTPVPTSCSWWDIPCTLGQWGGIVYSTLWIVWNTIYQAGVFAIAIIAFLTGIAALLGVGGTPLLPEPFNMIALIGVVFMWLFLLFEFVRRVKGMVFPS